MSGSTNRSREAHAEVTGFRSSLALSTSAWGRTSRTLDRTSAGKRESSARASGIFDDLDLSVWTIGFDAMLRLPLLKSPRFPKGQLQPYITVGPAIFVAHAEDSRNFEPSNQDDTDASVGVKVGAGVAWQFTKNIAMFGEYRYTH